jgi:hypothetical protein
MSEFEPTTPHETSAARPGSSATPAPSVAASSGGAGGAPPPPPASAPDSSAPGTMAKPLRRPRERRLPSNKSTDRHRCAYVCRDRSLRCLRNVLDDSRPTLDDSSRRLRWRSWIRQRGIQRSVWTGLRGSVRHGRQRVDVELHNDDISGSEGYRQRGVLYDIPEGHELDLGE